MRSISRAHNPAAAAVYRLTGGQLRVALEIARGRDLRHVAEALGIRVNTVKTQLRRMFDKVGGSSQAALVRVEAPGP